ncbi:DUF397 domain-containing protein [Actinocorallia longicatena]|uniref:DUF397 domain-containing protein n=1 Tax=Actinocorallia longicatena TaxID=111803 RepID=A0ABP6Q0U9_9ACTN
MTTPSRLTTPWRRSSHSGAQNCVEIAAGAAIYLRDGKNPDGAVLRVERHVWVLLRRGLS